MTPTDLFAANLGLAYHWANKEWARAPLVWREWEEVEQTALLQLWKAARLFDAKRGWKFSTYASVAIMQGLAYARRQASLIHIPDDVAQHLDKRERVGTEPPAHYAERVDYAKHARSMTNFGHGEHSDDGDLGLPEPWVEDAEPVRFPEKLWKRLNRRERRIIRRRFGIGCREESLKVLGEKLGICKERVRQVEQAALKKMRA